jgi:Lon protease-like protein
MKYLPDQIPIFPLAGVVMFPHTLLPLNIFETRYVKMFEKALSSKQRLIGMIQPVPKIINNKKNDFCSVGCAGKIVKFEETGDGRFLVTLRGLSRFNLISKKTNENNFKIAKVNWNSFENDLNEVQKKTSHTSLKKVLKKYFYLKNIKANIDFINTCSDYNLSDQLTMVCPLSSEEKQLLLETHSLAKRNALLLSIIEMSIKELDNSYVSKH